MEMRNASFLNDVAVLVLTYNEAPNIKRTLDALVQFPEIVVLDSGSTDATVETAVKYPNVRVVTRKFDEHAAQWNYGITQCGIARPWILALDADFVVSVNLVNMIAELSPAPAIDGFRIPFRYCIFGSPLSATLYPPIIALYRRDRTHYIQEGHTQRAIVKGEVIDLKGYVDHDDRKPLSRWFSSQLNYARLEAEYLIHKDRKELRLADRIRLMGWPASFLVFFYTLIWKRCILNGWIGWYYVLQRTFAEVIISLEIVERKLIFRHQSSKRERGKKN